MSKNMNKAANAKVKAAEAQTARDKIRVQLPSGINIETPFTGAFGRALWRGSTRFPRTVLSLAGTMMLNSSRAVLDLARRGPQWLSSNLSSARGLDSPKTTLAQQSIDELGNSISSLAQQLKASEERIASLSKLRDDSGISISRLAHQLKAAEERIASLGEPKDGLGIPISGIAQQLKATEELQRTVNLMVQHKIKSSNFQNEQHIQRTEGPVSITIRNSSFIQFGSTGEQAPSPPIASRPFESQPLESRPLESRPLESQPLESRPLESRPLESRPLESRPLQSRPLQSRPLDSRPVVRRPVASQLAASSPLTSPLTEDPQAASLMTEDPPAASQSTEDSPTASPLTEDASTASLLTEDPAEASFWAADPATTAPNEEDQVLAHMDLVMTRLPKPAKATITNRKRTQFIDRSRRALRTEVLQRYSARNSYGDVWCCIRREWMRPLQVCTAHLCPVSMGDPYLQYIFNDESPHLWNPENAIPISVELEDALDSGQIAIVPADDDDVDYSPDPHDSVPATNRFKVVVLDDTFTTKDGALSAAQLHGRLLGFQDPDFRPGLRYICFNVITTLARRQNFRVVGADRDIERLGDSRFLLTPGQFIHDSWLLKMCARLGLGLDGSSDRPAQEQQLESYG